MVIDQIVLVGESCHKDNRPGHDDQHPGPENRCLMGRRRWYPLLPLYIRNMHGLHQTPPCSERQTFCARSGNCRGYASHPLNARSCKALLLVRALALALHPDLGGAVAARITHLVGTGWTSRLFAKINVELLVDRESPVHRVAIHL